MIIFVKTNNLYRIKHKPTGLYYTPKSREGSNFSTTGRYYIKKENILSATNKRGLLVFPVFCEKESPMFGATKDFVDYRESICDKDIYRGETNVCEWEIETIK